MLSLAFLLSTGELLAMRSLHSGRWDGLCSFVSEGGGSISLSFAFIFVSTKHVAEAG